MILLQGTCGAAIMSEESMGLGFAGMSNKWDCDELDSNSVTGYYEDDVEVASAESGEGGRG